MGNELFTVDYVVRTNFRELLSEMDVLDYEEVTELLDVWYDKLLGNAAELSPLVFPPDLDMILNKSYNLYDVYIYLAVKELILECELSVHSLKECMNFLRFFHAKNKMFL
jgi:hypothetical protein